MPAQLWAGGSNPQKARVLLVLAIQEGKTSTKDLRKLFDQ
jgi:L-asparaginase